MSIGFLQKWVIFLNFNTIGIICEYNPFHFGHKYHIEKTKSITNCESVICIMSGSMVQRGECAIFDKWQRAKMAIDAGAELVIELPAYYALQSADNFAKGAVEILDKCGIVDAISFGCECGNIDTIIKAANIMTASGGIYDKIIRDNLKNGLSYPKACEIALSECMPEADKNFLKPNNTLGLCYVKALNELNSKIKPLCIERNNDYHTSKTYDEYMSASHIRKLIMNNEDYTKYSSDYSKENIYTLKNAESFILGYLRNVSKEKLKTIKGYEDGVEELIKNSAKRACTIEELFEMCVSKRYTMHRIKRYLMSAILDIDYNESASYARILAIGKNGAKLLKNMKQISKLDIITKVADYNKSSRMFETDIKATDFASLCSSDVNLRYTGKDYTISPYIEKTSL